MKVKSIFYDVMIVLLSAVNIFYFGIGAAQDRYGETAKPNGNSRRVTVNPNTTFVDVKAEETVTFNINGKSFTWKFDGVTTKSNFELGKISPAGILDHQVTVYVDRIPPDNS